MEQVKISTQKTIKLFLLLLACLQFTGCATLFDLGEEAPEGISVAEDEELDRGMDSKGERVVATDELAAKVERRPRMGQQALRLQAAIDTRDIILGMDKGQVQSSWGNPTSREVAGSGRDGHERWRYGSRYSLQGERVVIFENGKVIGWFR